MVLFQPSQAEILIAYDPRNSEVKEWPIGLETVNVSHPEESHVSLRAYDYNVKSGLISEIYGLLPTVVVHDESGSVIRTITINGLPGERGDNVDYFRDICMTDNHILILCGDPSVDESNYVAVVTHAGEPVALYEIRPTSTMSYDEANAMLITTNPEMDEGNIAVYGPVEL